MTTSPAATAVTTAPLTVAFSVSNEVNVKSVTASFAKSFAEIVAVWSLPLATVIFAFVELKINAFGAATVTFVPSLFFGVKSPPKCLPPT